VTTGNYHEGVKSVGIKQLKARLSEYVRMVRAGETVLVTERDEVVAELRPAHRRARPGGDIEEVLDSLAESGEITPSASTKGGWTWKARGLGLPPGTAQAWLDEIRGERMDR
jgi:prevent-host-death family protein